MASCKICGNANDNKSYIAREMMFGYRDEFEYFQCSECGCLQILNIPNNLSKYYPKNYHSYKQFHVDKTTFFSNFFKHQTAQYYLYNKSFIGRILAKISRNDLPDYFDWFKKAKVRFESEILDVGSGTGELLLRLQEEGFSNLVGIDPFIPDNVFYKNGIKIFKKELTDVEQQFDFIMLHHCFEHMPQPVTALKELWRLLKSDRYVLIRIPVASSFAWKKYGINWFQLDAPRHLFLHTIKSMLIIAKQVGFQVENIVFDSTEYQFYCSEMYLRDIPLVDPSRGSYVCSEENIKSFKAQADELNKNNDGDQACFYLYKK